MNHIGNNGGLGSRDGGSLPPAEELLDHFGTKKAWISLGAREKFIEEGLDCSTILDGLMHLKIRGK